MSRRIAPVDSGFSEPDERRVSHSATDYTTNSALRQSWAAPVEDADGTYALRRTMSASTIESGNLSDYTAGKNVASSSNCTPAFVSAMLFASILFGAGQSLAVLRQRVRTLNPNFPRRLPFRVQSNLPEPMGRRVQTTIIQPWAHSYLGDCYCCL